MSTKEFYKPDVIGETFHMIKTSILEEVLNEVSNTYDVIFT